MREKIVNVSDPQAVDIASDFLHRGEVIALPTDTVYGFACSANNPEAIQRLYSIKCREKSKPIAICVNNLKSFRYWSKADHLEEDLLQRLLPGAVTIVLNKSENLNNPYLNPGVSKIGIRIPDFNFIQSVCMKFELPIALTSANLSFEKSTLNVNEFKDLWPKLKAVFDGGQLGQDENSRSASTVIDLSVPGRFKIIREGVAIEKTLDIMKHFNIILDSNRL